MVGAAISMLLLLPACGGDTRPSDEEWALVWAEKRALVPDEVTLLGGGQPLCDDLVGEFRTRLPALRPTPTEALDDAVHAWVSHAESIVFECPRDPGQLAERLAVLDVLAAEIDAGLAADAG